MMQTSVFVSIQRQQPFTLGYMSLESPCKMVLKVTLLCLALVCTAADEVAVTLELHSQSSRAARSGTI